MTLVLAIVFIAVMMIAVSTFIMHLLSSMREVKREQAVAQTLQIAEAGLHQALAKLVEDATYRGEKATAFADGSFDTEVSEVSGSKIIKATGHLPISAKEFMQTVTAQASIRDGAVKILDWKQSRLEIKSR